MAKKRELSESEIATLQDEVRQVYQEFERLSNKYNTVQQVTSGPTRAATEIEQDRAELDRMVADDYVFVDPFGHVYDKQRMISQVLDGNVAFDEFRTDQEELRIMPDGNHAVSSGVFYMKGNVKVRYKTSGRMGRRDISGLYRTTHSFAKRDDGSWVVVASHMTKEPEEEGTLRRFFAKDWTHWPHTDTQ